MAVLSWFANSAELTISSGGSDVPVGVLKEVTFTPQFEHVPLYGLGSVKRQAIAKHTFKVGIKAKYAMWDPEADYIAWSVLKGTNTTDEQTGVDDSAQYRSSVATFSISAVLYDSKRTKKVTVTTTGVYFTSIPFGLTENEWVVRELEGEGSDFTMVYGSA